MCSCVPQVGTGIFKEFDYHQEARNADEFAKRHRFLGYVKAPGWFPAYSGPVGTARVLTMEWVHGRHLSALEPEEAARMTYMAVEAVTAGLVLTGLVHADPHEGNMMLADDGCVVM